MTNLINKLKQVLPVQRQIATGIISRTNSTATATETVNEDDTDGFGFTAAELAAAKPYTDIPSPKSYPIVGNLFSFKPFGDLDPFDRFPFCVKLKERHGNLVRLSLPFLPIVKNMIEVLDPADFEIVYRNEGRYPSRTIDPVLLKYRQSRKQGNDQFLFFLFGRHNHPTIRALITF